MNKMRLIDAEQLITEIEINIGNVYYSDIIKGMRFAIELINSRPTAFDKEKVIEELRSEASRWHESGAEFKDENEKGVAAGFRLATHIVEKGGIE